MGYTLYERRTCRFCINDFYLGVGGRFPNTLYANVGYWERGSSVQVSPRGGGEGHVFSRYYFITSMPPPMPPPPPPPPVNIRPR